jgi:hypothetical protein
MSLWYCANCKIHFAPRPFCPRCNNTGEWQSVEWLRDELDEQIDNDIAGNDTSGASSEC